MQEYQRVQQNGLDKLFYPAGMTSAQVARVAETPGDGDYPR